MTARILDGAATAAALRAELAERIAHVRETHGLTPGLAVIRVGDDAASAVYVRNKRQAAEAVGIDAATHELPADISENALHETIAALNNDPKVHGILLQLPVPPPLRAERLIATLAPEKDVDGLHPLNMGLLADGHPALVPCTPRGCMRLLEESLDTLAGASAVVIGRSQLVGKPLAHLLLAADATITIAHSRTRDLPELARTADVLVAAVGVPELVRGDWIKPGACVLDVGINRRDTGGLVGDVAFDEAVEVAGFITPVPGGVGPMTVACLLENTCLAACRQAGIDWPA